MTERLTSPKTPIFYDLAKIKKVFKIMSLMRSVRPSFNSCTFHISKFINYFLCYQSRLCKSCVRNTKDFSSKLNKIKKLPKNYFLFTLNVNTLYTNIDHDERAQEYFEKLKQQKKRVFHP